MASVSGEPAMMLRAPRKLTGMERMMPKSVAIIPMKMVSTIRWTDEQQRLAHAHGAEPDGLARLDAVRLVLALLLRADGVRHGHVHGELALRIRA